MLSKVSQMKQSATEGESQQQDVVKPETPDNGFCDEIAPIEVVRYALKEVR